MEKKVFNREEAQQKRNELKALSATVKLLMNTNELFATCIHVNDALILWYKHERGCTELNTFEEWREKGRQVCKGAKGFAVWGRKTQHKKKESESAEEGQKSEAKDFFPLAYLFDISQTKEIVKK